MSESSYSLSLNDAAQLANVHRTTIFRAIRKGELDARKLQQDGHKPQYFLDPKQFDEWLQRKHVATQVADSTNVVRLQQEQSAPHLLMVDFNRNLAEALRQAEQARMQSDVARDEARRLERQVLALQFELAKYQNALSESASSLVESRAREAEALAKLKEEPKEPLTLPVPDSSPPIEVELKEARTQLEFVERRFRRIPRWVQKLFGT